MRLHNNDRGSLFHLIEPVSWLLECLYTGGYCGGHLSAPSARGYIEVRITLSLHRSLYLRVAIYHPVDQGLTFEIDSPLH
jgi:hypothetical protein